jgi:hypothetical protein
LNGPGCGVEPYRADHIHAGYRATPMAAKALPGFRFDYLFSAASVLILVSVFIGFAPTYFFGWCVPRRAPNRVIHFHAVEACDLVVPRRPKP